MNNVSKGLKKNIASSSDIKNKLLEDNTTLLLSLLWYFQKVQISFTQNHPWAFNHQAGVDFL